MSYTVAEVGNFPFSKKRKRKLSFFGTYTINSINILSFYFSLGSICISRKHGHYSPDALGELSFKGKRISEKPMKVVFDSGSTYTHFDRQT